MNMLEMIHKKRSEGHPSQVILDQIESYLEAEQAERDAEVERQMACERDRLGRLAASYGCCEPCY